ncbi:hypothetical protein CPB84DRAFT_1745713 [Gymnopilus junonius]|uniref:Uncharacterized protein n=1 Tax=Gymnopilus junonius TaxID=109634 RepID=A0A9P5NT87_GYMJU|nr:hypothetical protein CPB84DRAFT_1745713 [Gymnopilus junonius]
MSTAMMLPNLSRWTMNHLTAIFNATNQADFNGAIDAFLSHKAKLTLNGANVSRAEFIKQFQTEKFDEAGAEVTFNDAVQVAKDAQNPTAAGCVGLFYNATIAENITVQDAAVTNQYSGSLNVVIEQDPDVPQPTSSPMRGYSDCRRVTALNQVSTEVPATTQSA